MSGERRERPQTSRTMENHGSPGYLVDPGPVDPAKVSEKDAQAARDALKKSTPDPL